MYLFRLCNVIRASKGIFTEDADERFLVSKNESLTPDIYKVIAVYAF